MDKCTKYGSEFVEGEARNEFHFRFRALFNDINDLVHYSFLLTFILPSGVRVCLVRFALLFPRLDPSLRRHAAVLEAVRLVTGLHDVAMVGQPVQQRRGHLGVAKHVRPFGEAQVGGDDDAGVLVQFRQQVK